MRIFTFIFSAFLFLSCQQKSTNLVSAKPVFRLQAFSEDRKSSNFFERRKLLVHLIYSTSNEKSEEVESTKKLLDNLKVITSSEHEKYFKKLIVSYPNYEQTYYVPEEFTNDWLESNLNISRPLHLEKVWINSIYKNAKVLYLVYLSKEEVLENEKEFQMKKINLKNIKEFEIKNLSKYQRIKLNIESFFQNPESVLVDKQIGMGNHCDHGMEGKNGNRCICQYRIVNYTSTLLPREKMLSPLSNHSLYINQNEILFSDMKLDISFLNQEIKNDFKVNLQADLDQLLELEGQPLNDECFFIPKEKVTKRANLTYDVEVNILGARESIEELNDFPEEIK